MTALEELKLTTEKLCHTIDQSIRCEKYFCDNICFDIERMNWELYRMMNDLKEINQYIGA